jgi:uncharacterized DUF497 family protein
MQFEWDRGKAASNRRKHGISFADATWFLRIHMQLFSQTLTIPHWNTAKSSAADRKTGFW